MIINGGSRSNARFFAKHLANAEENERVMLCEIRNLAALTIADALHEMEAVALATQCKNFFYHVNINPLDTEHLTPEQWMIAVDTLETNLGLAGHARFVVEHQKKGRVHRHVVWSRIAVPAMRAVPMTDDYEKHQATARHLEHEFHLEHVPSVLGSHRSQGHRPHRRAKPWETFRGKKSGIDPYAMKRDVMRLYRESATAARFIEALREHGYQLARADRRDFCIVDPAGHAHSLARRLVNVPAAAIGEFFRNVDAASLPTVKQARAMLRHH
ncbi:relaxase/mobilization nuclease domain-containing protein [Paludibaculum fermentans]|uniref:relaxase/mobilization nuclease domain-containing protein n=1 Tax=Paludibaculum fermentans TaxID=1473598 RepID=UPI003EB78B1C